MTGKRISDHCYSIFPKICITVFVTKIVLLALVTCQNMGVVPEVEALTEQVHFT